MSNYESWSLVWSALSAFSTFATCVVVAVAAVLTVKQVRESSRARELEAALAVLTHTSTPELRKVRRLVNMRHPDITEMVKSKPAWNQLDEFFKEISNGCVDADCFQSYLASLENISILVLHDLAQDEIIDLYFSHRAVKQWTLLKPFIHYMRETFGSDGYLQHFEMFVTLVKEDGLDIRRETDIPLFPLSPSQLKKRALLAKRREARNKAIRRLV